MKKPSTNQFVLGVWDGHDAGAALLCDDQVIFAINEERLSRRKLEVGFPHRSIQACLDYAAISPSAVHQVAVSTTDPAKTLTRLFPQLKEAYYLLRRRKKKPGRLDRFKKKFKYRFTELRPNLLSYRLSHSCIKTQLKRTGFINCNLSLLDHHFCHAQAAARCSGLKNCVVMTLDGVGDGLSGSIWVFKDSQMKLLKEIPARNSLGIFFEHVTNLLNMRELEDEGKVMALANYAYPIQDPDNPLMRLIETRGLEIFGKHKASGLFRVLKDILWQYPSEQFAFMAQRVLEKNVLTLVRNAVTLTGMRHVSVAGGVFSNIKLNMKIGELNETDTLFVFPHMGDGGLALGAAVAVNYIKFGVPGCDLKHLYVGPRFTQETIRSCLKKWGFTYRQVADSAALAAQILLRGEIVLWFQGRMEMGPRALGNRSILARPDKKRIRDRLNTALKKRVWYQPFCPSILCEDAEALLHVDSQKINANRFMTMAFRVREEYLDLMQGVISVDGTCRPHFVGPENSAYRDLLSEVKRKLGKGVILNTSFNIHGEPMVCSPDDALHMFSKTEIKYLFLEDYLVEKAS